MPLPALVAFARYEVVIIYTCLHPQVTRSYLNWEGTAVVDRLVRSVCQMDDLLEVGVGASGS